jgi:hypothetical protein
MTLKEQIMKLQTYKMHEGEDTVYVERDDVLKALEREPCEDAISRQAVIDTIFAECSSTKLDIDFAKVLLLRREIKALPSIQPIQPKPKTGYISINNVMSVFDDFMCGEVDEDGINTFLEMLKDKAESEE